MQNLVQHLIREIGVELALAHLSEKYKIIVVRGESPGGDGDLVSLKYDQIESPMREPIVQQCRGMVVHVPTGDVLAWPYNKFWNHGEGAAAPIDWASARVQEKLDGSLMLLYWNPHAENGAGEWQVASSGHPTAGGSFGTHETDTFREAFWRIWSESGMLPPDKNARDVTYMFELCGSSNRVVVKHEREKLILHGARHVPSGQELNRATQELDAIMGRWSIVTEFPISTVEDCLAAALELNPVAQEGFVVVDAQHNRVKIKSPRYVALHHIKGSMSQRRSIELWQCGEMPEVLTAFPELEQEIKAVHDRLDACASRAAADALLAVAECWRDIGHPQHRKEFAGHVKDKPWAATCFKLYGKPIDVDAAKAIMRKQTTQALERMLESVDAQGGGLPKQEFA